MSVVRSEAASEERLGPSPGSTDYGIRPVPPSDRLLGGFDFAVLWGDLGIGLLVLVTGAYLVPALGFYEALGAIAAGSFIGVALLALAGVAGADHGIPTMVLFRPMLGVRGSWVPSALNALQLVGWTAVELLRGHHPGARRVGRATDRAGKVVRG